MNWWNTINGLDLLWIAAAAYFAYRWRGAVREREALRVALGLEHAKVGVLLSCIRIGGGGLRALQGLVHGDDADKSLDSLMERIRRGVV